MKLTKSHLRKIIKEEFARVLEGYSTPGEAYLDQAGPQRKADAEDDGGYYRNDRVRPKGWSDREKLERGLGRGRGNLTFPDDAETEEVYVGPERFTGGSIDIEPLSAEEREASESAYYDLRDYLRSRKGLALTGELPSDQLKFALRWIAGFEGDSV